VAALSELAPDTPEIVLDLEIVRANIARAAAMARDMGVALRPHTRTHKLPQIARMQLEAGAVGVQVAKLGEAEVMADAGIEDILVGYPVVGDRKLARLADLADRVSISVTIDSDEVAAGISRVARERGLTIPALLELDTGLRRLGVLPAPELRTSQNGSRRCPASSSWACSPTRDTCTRRAAMPPRRSG
jgi:D-serine deaminase-like pyridoxal phosphate-dependent protein